MKIAVDSFWNAIQCDPRFIPGYTYLIEAYLFQQDIVSAQSLIEKVEHLTPSAELLFYKGLLLADSNVDTALERWNDALSKCGSHLPMDKFRRGLWSMLLNTPMAHQDWTKVIELLRGKNSPPLSGLHYYAQQKARIVAKQLGHINRFNHSMVTIREFATANDDSLTS